MLNTRHGPFCGGGGMKMEPNTSIIYDTDVRLFVPQQTKAGHDTETLLAVNAAIEG